MEAQISVLLPRQPATGPYAADKSARRFINYVLKYSFFYYTLDLPSIFQTEFLHRALISLTPATCRDPTTLDLIKLIKIHSCGKEAGLMVNGIPTF